MAPAGRETLDAIHGELGVPAPHPEQPRPLNPRDSGPEIVVQQGPAGRDTLAAIDDELRSDARGSLITLRYGDRVPNAPGATTPSKPPRQKSGGSTGRGRAKERPAEGPVPQLEPTEVFEVLTFVVKNPAPSALSSDASRREFVESRLRSRLPGGSIEHVLRIEVTPWTERETVILRVWLSVDGSE